MNTINANDICPTCKNSDYCPRCNGDGCMECNYEGYCPTCNGSETSETIDTIAIAISKPSPKRLHTKEKHAWREEASYR